MSHDPAHHKSSHAGSHQSNRLDAASRIVIQRFLCTVGIIGLWFLFQPDRLNGSVLAAAGTGAAGFTALFAFALREKFWAMSLNRWDEAIGYFGMVSLARAFS